MQQKPPVVSNLDVWRSAKVLIDGAGAPYAAYLASVRIEALRRDGDSNGEAIWVRILAAIRGLSRVSGPMH